MQVAVAAGQHDDAHDHNQSAIEQCRPEGLRVVAQLLLSLGMQLAVHTVHTDRDSTATGDGEDTTLGRETAGGAGGSRQAPLC